MAKDLLHLLDNQDLIEAALDHIENTWKKLERYNPHDEKTLIGLPHPYIVPSIGNTDGFGFDEMYYWDSYFIAQGLLKGGREKLASGMLENLLAMFRRFGIIPNGNRFYHTGKSQPPLLTSYIFDLYELDHDRFKLMDRMNTAKQEYIEVWLGDEHPQWRRVYDGLSRHYQYDVLHDLAETECGWDMNPRFYRRALNFLPIDLNVFLYKYETDFYKAAIICGEIEEAKHWATQAQVRQNTVNRLMWNKEEGFYFDFNFEQQKQGKIWSLAPYTAMWARMVTEKQAETLVKNLRKFEQVGGLATTLPGYDLGREIVPPMQWDYPNGWAPLHWFVVKGLQNYGYLEDAQRIAKKWLANNLYYFENHDKFIEKYNVVDPNKEPKDGVYPIQIGFGWTNAIFYRLYMEFIAQNLTVGVQKSMPLPLYA